MNLVIVESPHKAATIQKFLGDGWKVVSSKGHIRDLQEKELGVDLNNNFTPEYVVPADKKRTVAELKKLADAADMVWLASDEDREGEAISWHLTEALGLDPAKTRRITFHEITKNAILEAIEHPRTVDMNLVNAQQARRVLDRLVGYELSPVLWRKIRRGLSAGRVQSVALRLTVDREKEIMAFRPEPFYRVDAEFTVGRSKVRGVLDKKFGTQTAAFSFLADCIGARYTVEDIERKDGIRIPAAPFTTSTLQQEAGRKLRFPVSQTMRVAQSLYERGLITYMRTDSTNLSSLAVGTAKKYITETFGAEYSHPRQYKTHSKGAQEAHEAIRPTYIENTSISGTPQEQKLYNLIWKRTVACQMAEAKVMNTAITIGIDKRAERYAVQAAEILFDGFLKLYKEGTDDETEDEELASVPPMNMGQELTLKAAEATCKFTQAPMRYSEPTLVRKLEELGIGRPSTYAPTITTLTTERGYLVKGDKHGELRPVVNLTLKGGQITETPWNETVGADKGKLLPTEIGMVVTDYLVDNFAEILDYGFTANVESSFDEVAAGKEDWHKCIADFYSPFHSQVEVAVSDKQYMKVEREIGIDPSDGQMVVAKLGQFGPFVQKGEGENRVFASLPAGVLIESVTLEDALRLLALPRKVGQYEGIDIIATKGRFGPYLKYGDKNIGLPRTADPLTTTLEKCISLIEVELGRTAQNQVVREFEGGISVMNGRYGPYLKADGKNYKLPRGTKAEDVTLEMARQIVSSSAPTQGKRRFTRRNAK
ncbi:MAG: type I DNA topoisomerase [Bacteroidales bacterium]|nr:type I DNA topoisomerase [Bacteroidales bacterium]